MKETNAYKQLGKKRRNSILFFFAIIILIAFLDIITGSSSLTAKDTVKIILEGATQASKYHFIVWDVRMPITLTCICVGASLALAGEQMQTILQNPLASPYTLGVSSAAGFGASLSVITGFPFLPVHWLNQSASALIFALGTSFLTFAISHKHHSDTKGLVLIGIVITFFFNALQSLMQYLASQEQLSEIMHWMFGSLTKASWPGVKMCFVSFIVIFLLSMRFNWKMTAFAAGEERAQSLGINTSSLRRQVFIYSSILTAVSVAYVGAIGFIGLVAPHLARSYVGEDQRFLAPLSAMLGSIILLASSVTAKIIKPGEMLPVGIITNLLGVAFLCYLMIRKKI